MGKAFGYILNEEWKDIKGYEGLYQISSFGRVKALEKEVYYSDRNYYRLYPERILSITNYTNQGYKRVTLTKDRKQKNYLIHRLVAEAFVNNPNPKEFNVVNHKNELKDCNIYLNLEWCDDKYNLSYGTCIERRNKNNSFGVIQFDLKGNLVKEWDSIKEAAECLNTDTSNICKAIKGKYFHCKGFKWKYKDEEKQRMLEEKNY